MSTAQMSLRASFYVTSGTLRRDAPCYVQRQADADLYEALKQGQFCYVLTARQMGKSSLMVRTGARMREEGIGVAVLDLTAIGQNVNAEQWYGGLLSQVGQQLDLEEELLTFWEVHTKVGPLQRWMQAIRKVALSRPAGQVVIFIDEIDAVRSLPFSTDEFFAGIREFYNHRTEDPELERLTFCLLGVATPSDLIRDTRTTPFNIGQRIELHDFTNAEAASLARGLGREQELGATLLSRILHWTGGHPYLTQRLCQAVAEDVSVRGNHEVDHLCEELFFSRRAKERDDNLLFVRERMLRGEVDLAGLLSLYTRVRRQRRVRDDDTNQLLSILRLSGITRIEDGCHKVRNRIYGRAFDMEFVKQNFPNAELRRQRAAYRRGLMRAAAFAAVIIAAVAGLAAVATKQRDRAQLQERAYRHLLYVAHMNLAGQGWDAANVGRTQQLLDNYLPKQGEEDLRDFEWYLLWRLCHRELLILRHAGGVSSVAYSPDGKKLATDSSGHIVKLWDATTGQELATLEGDAYKLIFSPDGKKLATRSMDATTMRLWDATTYQELATLKVQTIEAVVSFAFSPDAKKLATGRRDGTVRLWDPATGQELVAFKACSDWGVSSVAYSPDGKTLATAGDTDGTVRLWDVARGQEVATLKGHESQVASVVYSPDGKRLATGGIDRIVKQWDTNTGQELATLRGHDDRVTCVAFSPDGRKLASGSMDRTVRLWDVATAQPLATLKGHAYSVSSVSYSPDGRTLATGSDDKTVKLWDVTTDQDPMTLNAHANLLTSVVYSPDGTKLATASTSKDRASKQSDVKIWDVATGQELATLKGTDVYSLAFSPDGTRLATASLDRKVNLDQTVSLNLMVKLWDVATRRELITLQAQPRPYQMFVFPLSIVAFSPDGKTLAAGSPDGIVELWDVTTGQELATLKGHSRPVSFVSYSPDGRTLATASHDKTVKLWEAGTGRELATLMGHKQGVISLAFSPDGKRLATGDFDGVVKLWDVATGQEFATLKGQAERIHSLSFSPDGKRLATGSLDQTVKLWDVATGEEVLTLKREGWVWFVAFSPDGKTFASGTQRTVQLWRAAREQDVLARKGQ